MTRCSRRNDLGFSVRHLLVAFLGTLALAACDPTLLRPIEVMTAGLGSGSVVSQQPPGVLDCGSLCSVSYVPGVNVVVRAVPASGSRFVGWTGCTPPPADPATCTLLSGTRAIARFEPTTPLPRLRADQLSGDGIKAFLARPENRTINTPGRFLHALGGLTQQRFKENWLFMARSESLQTGHAASPRVLLPSHDSDHIFSFALSENPSFPAARTTTVEYIQWDGTRFRFHEINLSTGTVATDRAECAQCHAGRPNWDAYDSWGGLLPFNRDRIYKGSVEAAALRGLLRLWGKPRPMREVLEQLTLPPDIVRRDLPPLGEIEFTTLDASTTVPPMPMTGPVSAFYPESAPPSNVLQDGVRQRLLKTGALNSDEGRGVDLFDNLTVFNARRIAQELIQHPRTPVDVRPLALTIIGNGDPNSPFYRGCDLAAALTVDQRAFFDARNGSALPALESNTRMRQSALPKLKADLQIQTLRDLIGVYGASTPASTDTGIPRIRQELFRRSLDTAGSLDVATGLMIDRENIEPDVAQLRYVLEPLGVAVDKWSLSVAGRSRTYTFADLFNIYRGVISRELKASLGVSDVSCSNLTALSLAQLAGPLDPNATPTYAEVQKILDRNCLQCHGTVPGHRGPYLPNLTAPDSYDRLLPLVVPGNLTS